MAIAYRTLIADSGAPDLPLEDPTVTGMVGLWRVGALLATSVRADWGEEGWRMVQARPAPQDVLSTIADFMKEI